MVHKDIHQGRHFNFCVNSRVAALGDGWWQAGLALEQAPAPSQQITNCRVSYLSSPCFSATGGIGGLPRAKHGILGVM